MHTKLQDSKRNTFVTVSTSFSGKKHVEYGTFSNFVRNFPRNHVASLNSMREKGLEWNTPSPLGHLIFSFLVHTSNTTNILAVETRFRVAGWALQESELSKALEVVCFWKKLSCCPIACRSFSQLTSQKRMEGDLYHHLIFEGFYLAVNKSWGCNTGLQPRFLYWESRLKGEVNPHIHMVECYWVSYILGYKTPPCERWEVQLHSDPRSWGLESLGGEFPPSHPQTYSSKFLLKRPCENIHPTNKTLLLPIKSWLFNRNYYNCLL